MKCIVTPHHQSLSPARFSSFPVRRKSCRIILPKVSLLPGGRGIALLLMMVFFFPLFSQDKTWDGGASTNSWMDGANWNPDGVPTTSQWVKLTGSINVVIPANAQAVALFLQVWSGATLTIEEDATLTMTQGNPNGRINMDSPGAVLTNYGTIHTGINMLCGITVVNNSHLYNYGEIIAEDNGSAHGLELSSGFLVNHGNILVDGTQPNGDGIYIQGGNSPTLTNYGTVTVTNTVGDGISPQGIFENYGTTKVYNTIDLMIEAEGGLQFRNRPSGIVEGTGGIHSAVFFDYGGTIRPGLSPGILFFENNTGSANFSSGKMVLEIAGTGGPGASNGHDQVKFMGVTANFSSSFTVEVELINGFVPQSGNSFVLMIYPGVTGQPQFSLPDPPPDLIWDLDMTSTSLTLTASGALPVILTEFSGKRKGEEVVLTWETSEEYNNQGFDVEHSENGRAWTRLGFVPASETTGKTEAYSFCHLQPLPGANYYRLRQTDYNGEFSFSPVVQVYFENSQGELQFFPNPVSDGRLTVEAHDAEVQSTIRLFDPAGRKVLSKQNELLPAILDVSGFQPGCYLLELEKNGKTKDYKVVIQ